MSCDERKDLLALHAAGAPDPGEEAALLEHLASGCPECAGSLAEAHAMLAHLPLVLEPVEPSEVVRQRLMRRVAADVALSASPAPGQTRVLVWPSLAAAAAAAAATFLLVSPPLQRRQAALESRLTQQAGQIRELEEAVGEADGLMQVLRSPEMLLVSITGTENQKSATGRILWDRDQDYWHLSVTGMTPAPPGKTYELWFVTAAEEKIPAGTFGVDASGAATLLVRVPAGIGPIVLAAVTDEPEGGSAQPTGSFQLLGKV